MLKAKLLGSREALKFVTVGIIIAYIIMSLFGGFLWFFHVNFKLNLIIGVVFIYICGYFYGKLAGVAILVNKRNHLWVGFFYGFLTLTTAVFFSSWVGFIQEGINLVGTNDNPFEDYIYRPVVLVTEFGLLPVILVGFWFGSSINKKGAFETD